MFPYSEVRPTILSRLDAEGTDYYRLDEDEIPNANAALDWCASQLALALESNKFSGEGLRYLRQTRIWQASEYGRIHFHPAALGHKMMSVVAVMPDPEFLPGVNITPVALGQPQLSLLRTNLSFYKPRYNAKRVTAEQHDEARYNIFMPGNEMATDVDKIEYAWMSIQDYDSSTYITVEPEMQIMPVVRTSRWFTTGRYVAVDYIRSPQALVQIGSFIELPAVLKDMFVSKMLMYIAEKQGDRTNLRTVAEQDIVHQIKLLGW
jgi:hypothetical protein